MHLDKSTQAHMLIALQDMTEYAYRLARHYVDKGLIGAAIQWQIYAWDLYKEYEHELRIKY